MADINVFGYDCTINSELILIMLSDILLHMRVLTAEDCSHCCLVIATFKFQCEQPSKKSSDLRKK